MGSARFIVPAFERSGFTGRRGTAEAFFGTGCVRANSGEFGRVPRVNPGEGRPRDVGSPGDSLRLGAAASSCGDGSLLRLDGRSHPDLGEDDR